MRVQNRYLPSAVHRLFNGLLALFVAAALGVAGISFFREESVLWSLSGWVLLLSPVLGLVLALVNPNRFSFVRGVAGDAGYDGLRQVRLLNVRGLSANNSFERTNTLRVFAAQLMIRQPTLVPAVNSELTLDVGHASTSRSLHEMLAAALCFPGWHGMNWDAFWDSAIDSRVTFPRRVTLLNFTALEKRLPAEAQMFREALEGLAKRMPISVVAFDDQRNVVGQWGGSPSGIPNVG